MNLKKHWINSKKFMIKVNFMALLKWKKFKNRKRKINFKPKSRDWSKF